MTLEVCALIEEKIQPAVYDEKTELQNRNSNNSDFVEKVAVINVKRAVQAIVERSPILKDMLANGEIKLVGGVHEISTGEVTFYEN